MPSFEEVNYALRPAKNIERKMFAEAFQKLSPFGSVSSYRYVGFGSPYFSDFTIFHRLLGIRDMVSVEVEAHKRARFEFNKPFSCVDLRFGHSSAVLPRLPWDQKTILWLDYDYSLNGSVLADVSLFCTKATSGSVVAVTIDTQAVPLHQQPRAKLIEAVGRDRVPRNIDDRDLVEWGTARVSREIVTNEIEETLIRRNGGLGRPDHLLYKQLFNFHYADGAKMATVGGVIYARRDADLVGKCRFGELKFVRTGDSPYVIEVPKLTFKELRHLDAQLPAARGRRIKAAAIPRPDVQRYARVYRHFPSFVEAEF